MPLQGRESHGGRVQPSGISFLQLFATMMVAANKSTLSQRKDFMVSIGRVDFHLVFGLGKQKKKKKDIKMQTSSLRNTPL